jgi:AcrR family transcriptional regulator
MSPSVNLLAQSKRAQILRGAMENFLEEGYEGTSMDRVATAAGVSKITIYRYFHDKEGLFVALIKHVAAQRFDRVFGAVSFDDEPRQVLRQLAAQVLYLFTADDQYAAFLRLIIGESGRFPALAQLFIQALPHKVWQTLIHYFTTHPKLHISQPEAAARVFTGTLLSYAMTQHILHGHAIAPMDAQTLIDYLVDLILANAQVQEDLHPEGTPPTQAEGD